jgi:hypothetical protein
MRKVLSFVLVLSLVLGSFGMAFAAPLSDVAGEKCEDAVNVLTQLGVVSGYPDGEYKPDNIVTRAEMAVIVVRALGLADYAIGTASFSDMAGHWSNPYVAYATSLGIIDGYPDGTFRPDNTVSYDEAAKMLVAALGYTPESLTGTWPANYVVKAQALGILKGIKAGSAGANRGDIAVMAFQTLTKAIGTVDKDGVWTAINLGTINDPEDDTMLVRLGATKANDGDPFVLTNEDADSAVVNVRDSVGAYVTAYENSDGDIIAVSEESVFVTGEMGSSKFEADKDYAISSAEFLDGKAVGFKNGELDAACDCVNTDEIADLGTVTLAVKVSGTTIKEVYSVMVWEVDEADQFATADADDIDEDQELFGLEFPLNDDEEIDYSAFELVGVDSLDDIEKDNVVYVYAGADAKTITKVAVGTEVVSGEITRVTTAKDKYTIGGKAYAVTEAVVGAPFGDSVGAGDEVDAYLDFNGDIYAFELIEGEADTYAIVLEAENGTPGKLGTVGKLYLFLADGSDKVFEVDEDIAETLETDWEAGQLILYSLDKDGVIDDVEAVSNDPGTTDDITAKGYFDGLAINSDAVIFTFSGDYTDADEKADADNYSATTLSKVLDSDDVVAYAYDVDSNKIAAMLIDSDITDGDEVFGVVTDQAENNSDLGYEVTMLIDGKSVTYDTDEDNYDQLTLYAVTFNADEEATLDSTGVTAGKTKNVGATNGLTLSGSVVKDDDEVYTLDSDIVVYIQDGSKFKVGSTRDIIRSTNVTIEFYDVYDDDRVYDVVLIKDAAL